MRAIKAGTCKVESCTSDLKGGSNGVCGLHYDRAWKKWGPKTSEFIRVRSGAELLDTIGMRNRQAPTPRPETAKGPGGIQVVAEAPAQEEGASIVDHPDYALLRKAAAVRVGDLEAQVSKLGAQSALQLEQLGLEQVRYANMRKLYLASEQQVQDLQAVNVDLREAVERANATAEAIGDENKQLKERLEMLEMEEATAPRSLFVRRVDLDAHGRPRIILGDSESSPGAGVRASAHLIGTWVRLMR